MEDAEALLATYEAGIVAQVFSFGRGRRKLRALPRKERLTCVVSPGLR